MKRFPGLFVVAATLMSLVFARSAHPSVALENPPAPQPPVHPVSKPAEEGNSPLAALSGKVAETVNSGGYTYVCLEKNGQKTWAAVPEMKVAVGQELALQPGQEMVNFTSKALNRTFEKIIFSAGPVTVPKDVPSLSGKVAETVNSGGYTYVRLEKNGQKTWAAMPEMKVTVGQHLTLAPGQEMINFSSRTLNRTFEKIVFSSGPLGGKAVKPRAAGSRSAVVASAEKISVEKATGPDAYTVAELYANRTKLNRKTVVVKGKVVKVSAGIMGMNWIHLQDGSGNRKKGTHDLVVTSRDLPAVGDIVTAKGTLYKNKDFGSGYRYEVIVEKAAVTK